MANSENCRVCGSTVASLPFNASQGLCDSWSLGAFASEALRKAFCCIAHLPLPMPNKQNSFEISQKRSRKQTLEKHCVSYEVTVSFWLVGEPGFVEEGCFLGIHLSLWALQMICQGKITFEELLAFWCHLRLKHSCFSMCNFNVTMGKICF